MENGVVKCKANFSPDLIIALHRFCTLILVAEKTDRFLNVLYLCNMQMHIVALLCDRPRLPGVRVVPYIS